MDKTETHFSRGDGLVLDAHATLDDCGAILRRAGLRGLERAIGIDVPG
jgi:hypothetical protein